jgi:hypothetical protein
MYNYLLSECDIQDKQSAEQFRCKRAQWIEWLSGKDRHSLLNQIYSLLWDDALFRTVNELRRVAAETPNADVGFNTAVVRLFDAGFATTQATAIRRLTEKPKSSPKLAVISLRRVLLDIQENLHLVTRENYVAYDGLPYDPSIARQKWQKERMAKGDLSPSGTLDTKGREAWHTSELVHRNFDKLSKVKSDQRQRADLIREEWFDYLEQELGVCDDIRKYVDKFIAHGADLQTRQNLSDSQKGISLERLETCHKAIYQVASFTYGPLLWEGTAGGLPVPQYDHLANLDKKWVSPAHLKRAYEVWDQMDTKVREWESESLWPTDSDSGSI